MARATKLLTAMLLGVLTLALSADPASARGRSRKGLAPGETIDLNAATFAELKRLPGIGKGKARAILEYRESNGPFTSVEQLDRVKGIGKKTVDKLRPFLRLGPARPGEGTPPSSAPAADKAPPRANPDDKAFVPPKDESKGADDVEEL